MYVHQRSLQHCHTISLLILLCLFLEEMAYLLISSYCSCLAISQMVECKFKSRLMLMTAFNSNISNLWLTKNVFPFTYMMHNLQLLQIERELQFFKLTKVHWNRQLSCSFSCPFWQYGHETQVYTAIMRTIFKCMWITPDPLGMVTHTQIVDTRLFFFVFFWQAVWVWG